MIDFLSSINTNCVKAVLLSGTTVCGVDICTSNSSSSPIVCGTTCVSSPIIHLTSISARTTETAIAYLNSAGCIVSGTSSGGGISGTGTIGYVPIFTGNTAIGDSIIYGSGTGVGIGDVPTEKLQVFSGNILLDNDYALKIKNASGTAIRTVLVNSNNDVYIGAIDAAGGNTYLRAGGATAATISPTGNFGIGGTPTYKFEVFGTLGNVQIASDGAVMNFTRPTTSYFRASVTGGQFAWAVNGVGTNVMVLDTAGALTVASTVSTPNLCLTGNQCHCISSPASSGVGWPMYIRGQQGATSSNGGDIYICGGIGGASSSIGGDIYIFAGQGTTTGGGLVLCGGQGVTGGNIDLVAGCGSTTKGVINMCVWNGATLQYAFRATPASSTCIYYAGSTKLFTLSTGVCIFGCGFATDFIASSDKFLKKDIQPISNALSIVTNLCGVCYRMCDDINNEDRVGLIAQDVESILPEIVSYSEPNEDDKKYGITDKKLGLKYDKLTAVLIEAIKEQQLQINSLREEINIMKNK